ncbi:hypothetical protein LOK49_LG08G00679 [Camellia lanceoleosa]|uniref:Uncharacterized protein n=1 Tax=Camellia lanceoleosa TaxID=1840588 RepID=A0ACC0GTD6_9ERIC|nr:hypothetical protein LOK49_LG08G00679 [Camellia lanceoleosa]
MNQVSEIYTLHSKNSRIWPIFQNGYTPCLSQSLVRESEWAIDKARFPKSCIPLCLVARFISLTKNVVDMIFYVFDTNLNGSLSDEFLRVLHRWQRDVVLPREGEFMGCFLAGWSVQIIALIQRCYFKFVFFLMNDDIK